MSGMSGMSEIYGYDFSGPNTILVSSGIPKIVAEDVVQQLANGIIFSIPLLVYQYNGKDNIVPFTGRKIRVDDRYCFKVSNDMRRSIIKLIRENCWATQAFKENVIDEAICKPKPINVCVGFNSGTNIITGSNNVAIGRSAELSSASYNVTASSSSFGSTELASSAGYNITVSSSRIGSGKFEIVGSTELDGSDNRLIGRPFFSGPEKVMTL
jgi:hypothetical protein